MAYVAVKGGKEAIENAEQLLNYQRIKSGSKPLEIEQIKHQLFFLVDRVMGEGSLYAPDLAALAIKQAAGDTLEAAFILRACRISYPRLAYSLGETTNEMRVIRRISAAFKDIPDGQILGPTQDYVLRLFNYDLADEKPEAWHAKIKELVNKSNTIEPIPDTFPKVVDILRQEGLMEDTISPNKVGSGRQFDITRDSLMFPSSRSARLQALTRGETGGLLVLAYSNMRGYGAVHPTVGELRVGYLPVHVIHPYKKTRHLVGEVKVTEAEIISHNYTQDSKPKFSLGYGLCFGHNETKAISMAVLDRATQSEEPSAPSEDEEFVISHIDGIESMGFCNHFKLPHYVTFQSALDRLRKTQKEENGSKGMARFKN